MSLDEIRAAIHAGMQDVADRFAEDPRPTDGSIRAEQEVRRRLKAAREAGQRAIASTEGV